MKCPRCKGCGRAIILVKQKEGFYATEQTVCPECNGKGIIEQTNEEWLCGLDTEDKAREISDMTAQGYWSEELVYKWLKEKHNA